MEKKKSKLKSLVNPEEDDLYQVAEGQDESTEGQEEAKKMHIPPMMTPNTMAGGILLIDAIGKEARIEFMTGKLFLGHQFGYLIPILILTFTFIFVNSKTNAFLFFT
jgi:hypothetical protein